MPEPQVDDTGLPDEADVVVVGAGYTGLCAAFELAARGRHVVVIERGVPGRKASGVNGGMVHAGVSHDLVDLLALEGGEALWRESLEAFAGVEKLAGPQGISCGWQLTGHLQLAGHPRHVHSLRRSAAAYRSVGEEARFVQGGALAEEVGSSLFAAGLVVERSGALQPAAFAAGLLHRARSAGAVVIGGTEVLGIEARRPGYKVSCPAGVVRAGAVVLATGATTPRSLSPWTRRRILPVGSFIIATEPIEENRARAISPAGRMFFDTRNFLNYWRLDGDGRRVLFGGRTSFAYTTVEMARDRLYAAMLRIHPQLAGVRVERAWGGLVDLTVDRMPRMGRDHSTGALYALGYSGTGVALSTHFGKRLGQWLAGEAEPPLLALRPASAVPVAARVPGLLRVAGWWFRGRDALGW